MFRIIFSLICLLGVSFDCAALSVKEKGAVGDGQADDTAAIQQALDAGAGIVDLPSGEYLLTDTLYVSEGGGLRGEGMLAMTVDRPVVSNRPPQEPQYDNIEPGPSPGPFAQGMHLEGFTIRKQRLPGSHQAGIEVFRVEGLTIRNVEVSGLVGGVGIRVRECQGFLIEGCYIHDFLGDWEGDAKGEGLGISPRHSARGRIVNNRIENINVTDASARRHYYQTDAMEPHSCTDLTIMGNTIRDVGEGIDLVNCRNVTVSGNIFERCWHFGVKIVHGTRFATVVGNTIRDAGLMGISMSSGNLEFGGTYGHVLMGNMIVNVGAINIPEEEGKVNIWTGIRHAGIEIVHDNREGNDLYDYAIASNLIYDDQDTPTCSYGIIEKYAEYGEDGEASGYDEPRWSDPDDRRIIKDNVIRGMMVESVLISGMENSEPKGQIMEGDK